MTSVPLLALEPAGVVDQDAEGAECHGCSRDQGLDLGFDGEIGREGRWRGGRGRGPRCRGLLRLGLAGMAMHGDIEPGTGQPERDGAAEALRPAGDEGGAGNLGEITLMRDMGWLENRPSPVRCQPALPSVRPFQRAEDDKLRGRAGISIQPAAETQGAFRAPDLCNRAEQEWASC